MAVAKRTHSLTDLRVYLVGKGADLVVEQQVVMGEVKDTCWMSCRLQAVKLTCQCSFRPEWTTTRRITCSDRMQLRSQKMKWVTNSCQIDSIFATEE